MRKRFIGTAAAIVFAIASYAAISARATEPPPDIDQANWDTNRTEVGLCRRVCVHLAVPGAADSTGPRAA